MQRALEPFRIAHANGDAYTIADLLSPFAPRDDPGRLYDFHRASNEHQVEYEIRSALKYTNTTKKTELTKHDELAAWTDIFVKYWRAVGAILRAEEATNQGRLGDRHCVDVYDAWKDLVNAFMKHLQEGSMPPWALIAMYYTANHLRKLAVKADEQIAKTKGGTTSSSVFQDDIVSSNMPRSEKLEDTARVYNRMFALCSGDRNPVMSLSRKWGTYYVANLQFKTYFKLKNVSLSKNIVRSVEAQSDLPPFEQFPASHRVTYNYYVGVLAFLQENYERAEKCLTQAWDLCLPDSTKNQELILTYLIPCRLITTHNIPTQALLSSYPRLKRIFGPLVACIKSGDLAGFDQALVDAEDEFVKRRIYLTLERGRDIAVRNLLRKVFLAAGFEELKEGKTEADRVRKSRIPVSHFAAALRMRTAGQGNGQVIEDEEVECILANQIYKGLMKGYISREHSMVVLNKKGAFPNTGV